MGKRLLLVEGSDDLHVMMNLFEVRRVPEEFDVAIPGGSMSNAENGGIERLINSIPIRLRESELECLAIVVDADSSATSRWESIHDRLVNAGINGLPGAHSDMGTIAELYVGPEPQKQVRFGLGIMPDNQSTGMLEDFVAGMIDESDAMLPQVDGFLASIPAEQRRYSNAHAAKARLHTWLAISERPGRPMGQAIKADSYLNANHPSVDPFLDWLRKALVD